MTNDELNNLQAEAYDHLWNGRHRMALVAAEKLFESRPNDGEAAICLAWAYLENGQPTKAMEYANLAVELKGDLSKTRFFRAYILTRMSIFEGAIADIEKTINKEKNLLSWTYLNQARAYAGLKKFEEANKAFSYGLLLLGEENKEWSAARIWFQKANIILSDNYKVTASNVEQLIKEAHEALKCKEPWYALFAAQKILTESKFKRERPEVELIELEAMYQMFQYIPALKKAETMKSRFQKNDKFNVIYNALLKFIRIEEEEFDRNKKEQQKTVKKKTIEQADNFLETETHENYRMDTIYYPNDHVEIFSIKLFDSSKESQGGVKQYFKQISRYFPAIGVEVIFNNLLYGKENINYNCCAVWYLNDYEIGKNNFRLNVPSEWDSVIFSQSTTAKKQGLWNKGQAKVEIYVNDFKVGERFFGINESPIEEKDEIYIPIKQKQEISSDEVDKKKTTQVEEQRSLDELIAELDSYIGLSNIKQSVRDFISYLDFLKERKRHGLKAEDKISINVVFLGNPGTGKTTIARLLGNILRAMRIIPKGHVVEVDRAGLVGQYIGETAQKTEKIINDAIGGILFIDEAYTLVKKGGTGQDFGQEAIDILLKRMEDRKGEFVVITAGYPDEMNTFLNSNPGMKSRFTHTFNFEDYTPDELIQILESKLVKEEYKIDKDAKELLKKELIKLYRGRDKTFGNARLVNNIFDGAKINLGKRVLSLPIKERTKDVLNTITVEDISKLIGKEKIKVYNISINEEALAEALDELKNLVGLKSVKKEIYDLVKLAKFFAEQGENLTEKFGTHYLFLGNPGTGKTTVARIFSKIFSALGILSKGHLVETDRQGIVAGYIGQTAEKTSAIIEKSLGGTLFIDEAYTLVKKGDTGSDFGKEAIDILLKRMEDDRGKFITIAAGYTDEMNEFVAGNPGIQSRFQKSITFDDYTPKEMLEIVNRTLNRDKKKITKEAQEILLNHFNDLYKTRDKKFGNARIVRNLVESAKQKHMLRVADIPQAERTEEKLNTIILDDVKQVLNVGNQARDYEVKGDPLKLQEYIDELNSLTGLDNVKLGVYKLISGSKVAQLRKERGLHVINKNLHAAFIGNAGTGKTTVAKLFSKILKELGVLEKGHIVKVDRSDLVGGYQGQTSVKTDKIIQEAMGGTLFIEDAFSLGGSINDFGHEAIDTLIKRMKDHEGKFVVVLSGCSLEMQSFLESNPILRSHISNIFEFEDYTPRQLLAIAYNIAENNGYTLDEGALQTMLEYFIELYERNDPSFVNAKTAKNVLYTAISNQEERIANMIKPTNDDLKTVTLEDVQSIII